MVDLDEVAPDVAAWADAIVDPVRTATRVEEHAGRFLDTDPMGASPNEYDVWLRTYHQVRVVHETRPETIYVDITVAFDRVTHAVLAAWTPPRPQWVLPSIEPVSDADSLFMADAVYAHPARPDSLQASVPDVLGMVWRYQVNPLIAGQVVLRPRFVLSRQPGKRVGRRIVPVLPAATRWVATTYGVRILSYVGYKDGRWVELYSWGAVMLVNDHPCRWLWLSAL